jgi:hypothetical protein
MIVNYIVIMWLASHSALQLGMSSADERIDPASDGG